MLIKDNIQTLTGAESVIYTLKKLGIDTIFGYPGGIVLDLYDELYKQNCIKHILTRHEQAAVHAAEGYARVTGKCGVVLVTSGPGATNTITGIANAYSDGYPLLTLTGQVDKKLRGKDSLQVADICDISKSCTKAVFQITDANDIHDTIVNAYKLAITGKKGPVVVDMAKNIFTQNSECNCELKIQNFEPETYNYQDINRIMTRINNSSRPVVVVGGGVNHSNSSKELEMFISKFNFPFVSTMMGLGAFDSENKNYYGMIGIFGDNSANEALRRADLIISLGARFNDRITCMFKNGELENKIVQVDINPKEISRVINPIDYIVGDIKNVLNELSDLNNNFNIDSIVNWRNEINSFKVLNKNYAKHTNLLHSFEVIEKLQNFTKDKNVIFTSEVGQHQIWAVKGLKFNPDRKILVSGGLGTMGFGLPAAIGASIAQPDKTIVCICGDGSLQMSIGELALCKDYGLNIKILIFNNGYLGMVRQLQEKNCNSRYNQTKISNPNFVELARSYGIDSVRVNSLNSLEDAFNKAFSNNNTFIIDFEIEPEETL